MKTISKLLEYELSLWKDIPEPEGVFETKTIDWIEFNVGTFSWQEIKNYFKSKASVIPEDPKLDGTKYIYALDTSGKKYILKAVLESGEDYYLANFIDNEGILASHKNKKWENLIWILPKTTGLNLPDVTTPSNKAIENVRYTSNEVVVPVNQIQSSVGSNGLYVMSDWKIWWTPSDFIWKENEKQRIVYVSVILWNETENKRVSIAVTVLRDSNNDGIPDIENTNSDLNSNSEESLDPEVARELNKWKNRFDSECFDYKEYLNNVKIISFKNSCDTKDIVIPENINGKPVTEIRERTFMGIWLTSIVLPRSLKYIWTEAFSKNRLTSISAPWVLRIGLKAFSWNKLTSIDLPNVTEIWDEAFSWNKLTSIDLPKVINIWNRAFIWNSTLTSINLPEVLYIGKESFYWTGKKVTLKLPKVLTIGKLNFYNAWLAWELNLPEVRNIELGAFQSNNLTSVNIPKVESLWVRAFAYNKITTINLPNAIDIGERAFRENQLTSIKLPKVKEIWGNAFSWGFNQIAWELNLPEVTTIWDYAFGWNQLTSINIEKIVSIWQKAFWGNNLTKVVLPTWVKINDSFSSDVTIEYK